MGGKSSTPRENPQVVPSDGQNDHPPSQEEGSSSKPSPPAPAQKLQPGPQQNLQSEDPSKYSSSSDSRRALTSCPQPPPLGPNKIVQRPGIEVNKRWPLFHGRLFDLLPPLKNRSIARDGRMTVNLDSQRAQLLTIRIGDRDDRALCIVHARRGEDQHGYHDFQLELQFQPGIGGRFTNVQLEVKLRAPGQPDRPIQFSYFPNSTVSPKETEEGKLQDLDTSGLTDTYVWDTGLLHWELSEHGLRERLRYGVSAQTFHLLVEKTRVEASLRLACRYQKGSFINFECSAPEGNQFLTRTIILKTP